MRIVVACDHRGFEAKRRLIAHLSRSGHEIHDIGCDGTTAVDYPDYGYPAALCIAHGKCDVGLLFEGSGLGMTIVANRIPGVRAALVHDEVTARRAREHHHCNMLSLAAEMVSEDQIRKIVEAFLSVEPGNGRHARRVSKVEQGPPSKL